MRILDNHARLLGAIVLLGAAVPTLPVLGREAGAQGLAYDMKMSIQKGTGATAGNTQVMMSGHGKFQDGNSRMDMDESVVPGGFMGQGTYVIVKNATRNEWIVDPAKQQYFEMNVDSATKFAMASTNMLGGLVKMETSDVTVDVQPMGPGEMIQGYSTMKYRLTTSYVSKTAVLWKKTKTTNNITSDIWVAPQLSGLYNPASAASQGGSSELAQKTAAAYAKIGKGAVIKTVSQMQSTGDDASTMTMTMELLNITPTRVPSSTFDVPASYTKIDGTAALSALGGATASEGTAGAAGTTGNGGTTDGKNSNIVDQLTDSAKAAAKQGAVDGVKDKAKGAIGKLFGRP